MFALSDPRRNQIIRMLHWTALALFILSLLSPSVSSEEIFHYEFVCKAPRWTPGWVFFLIGLPGVLTGQFGWIANPLMLFAALKKSSKSGFALAAVALIVVTAFSYTFEWRDGGVDVKVCGFGLGYYLWLGCSVLVLVATLLKPAKRYDAPSP